MLKNATWIFKHQKVHYPINPNQTRDTWNIFGNRIKHFFEKFFEVGSSLKTPKNKVFDKWLHHALENQYPANERKKFFELFDEIVGTAPMNMRMGVDQVYGYSGFGLKSDDAVRQESQIKIKRFTYKCDSCSVVYLTNEPIERLRVFHKGFFPDHLIIQDISKE